MKDNPKNKKLAKELNELWQENEKSMGEMAAYQVSCEQLEIDPDDGWEYLALIGDPVSGSS